MVKRDALGDLFESLIPLALRKTLVRGSSDFVRVRALATILVAITTLSIAATLLVTLQHLVFQPELLYLDLISMGIISIFILQTWIFYKFGNYKLSGKLLTHTLFVTVLLLVIVSGGYDSEMRLLLLCTPMIACLIGGQREGIYCIAFTVVVGLLLTFMKSQGIVLENMFQQASGHITSTMCWVILIALMATCLTVYEYSALEKLQGDKKP